MGNDDVKTRRYLEDVRICGIGVIALGIWSVVKGVALLFFDVEGLVAFDNLDSAEIVVALVVIALLMILIYKMHLYVGLNAVRFATGKKYKKGFVPFTVFMIILTALGMIPYKDDFAGMTNIDTTIASIIVDLTTIYVFAVILVSVYRIRKTGTQQGKV